jgi:predicted metal-binding membrane protein
MMTLSWAPMMAAMMLPSAVPAIARRARRPGALLAAPVFAGSYVVTWTLVGLGIYALAQPHGALAGALLIAGGLYELTPIKRECRRRCRAYVRSGPRFSVYCVGSSIGLMATLVALGAMSLAWMSVVAVVVLAQKLLAPRAAIDVPLALAIVALGVVVAVI